MSVRAIKGIVEKGQVRLTEPVALPENADVYVIVLESARPTGAHIYSPRLADPRQMSDFRKEVSETSINAAI
jgi:hypothetical protein